MNKIIALSIITAVVMVTASHSGAATKPTTRDRAEIPSKYTWNLSDIYPDWDAWEADLVKLQGLMDAYQELKGTLAEGPERILEASTLSDDLGQVAFKVFRYPGLTREQDTRDNEIQAKLGRVQIIFAKFGQAMAWYSPELLSIPEETMLTWLDDTPGLAPYRFGITELYRQQEHVLDEDRERLLAYAGPLNHNASQTYGMLGTADVKFSTTTLSTGEEVVATHANYGNGIRSYRVQEDREKIFKTHFEIFDKFPNTYASIYNGILQRDWFVAQARGYNSTLEADLDGNNIPMEVVDNLIATAKAGAEPLQRYNKIRKKVLGLESYRYFDSYIPLVEIDWPIHYDDVQPILLESVSIYGPEYQAMVKRSFDERWIDVYENEGKSSGAFSAGVYGVHPYMLLNYADTLNDAFTVAHEMGHTMHTVLASSEQPYATASYTTFVAEVASMTNENFFLDRLLEVEKDPKRRIALLEHAIEDIASGFYRQTMFADFELQAHRAVENGQPITAVTLQKIFLEVLNDFFGDSLDDQEWYRNTWARIPHFFNSPYYVYQYATSKSAASLFHRMMTTGEENLRAETVMRYLDMLKSGGNDHPVELLKKAGVDFNTAAPMEALVATMDSLVAQLEQELKAMDLIE